MGEKLQVTLVHTAPCGQEEPIEWYAVEGGYSNRKCRNCGAANPVNKVVLLSPTLETTFPYGVSYFCNDCMPDLQKVVATDTYYDLLYGKLN